MSQELYYALYLIYNSYTTASNTASVTPHSFLHWTEEDSEACRGETTCLRLHGQIVKEPESKL